LATFCIDSQATIKAIQLTKPKPGHYIFNMLHKSLEGVRNQHLGIRIMVRWTPGHEGIKRNEKVDEEAKRAITKGSSNQDMLPKPLRKTLLHSKSALKWDYSKKLKVHTQKAWEASPCHALLKKTDPTAVSTKYLNLITDIPRKHTSILTQLRTGHAPLAKHLHHIGKTDSPTCPACHQNEETVEHLILHCTVHHAARQVLQYNTGGTAINITKLLTTPKTLRALFHFIAATNQFHDTFREIPTIPETK